MSQKKIPTKISRHSLSHVLNNPRLRTHASSECIHQTMWVTVKIIRIRKLFRTVIYRTLYPPLLKSCICMKGWHLNQAHKSRFCCDVNLATPMFCCMSLYVSQLFMACYWLSFTLKNKALRECNKVVTDTFGESSFLLIGK